MEKQSTHSLETIDEQIERVINGSVVLDNTASAVTLGDNKPVSSVAVKGAIRPLEEANNIITVSIGSYQDADGITLVTRTDRARTSIILRKDLVGQYIAPPAGYYFYTYLLDKNLKKIDVKNWVGTENSPLNIDALPENVAYLTMSLKNSYAGNTSITDGDLVVLQNWANTTLSPISKIGDWEYVIMGNRGIDNAITIKDGIVSIQAGGFGIIWKGNTYYVANTNTSVTTPYTFNLGQYTNNYLVLNTKGLLNKDVRNELSELVSVRPYIREGDVPIAYHYMGNQVVLLGQFKDLYGGDTAGNLEVVNNLTQGGATAALSAEMGKELNTKLLNLDSTNTPISISVGSYLDNDGLTPVVNVNRARTSIIARKDIIGMSLMPPTGYYMWVFQLDSNFRKVGNSSWIGGTSSPLYVDNLADNVLYLTISFKNSYNGDTAMEESHILTLQQWVNSQLYVSAKINNWDYVLQANISIDGAIKTEGTHIIIKSSGFGIRFKGKLYYVANTDTTVTEPYDFDLGAYGNLYLCLDTSLLTNPNARNNLADVVVVRNGLRENDIPIAYRYMGERVYLLGQFKDIYGGGSSNTELTSRTINSDIFFAPEYYAFCRGKKLNTQGEGAEWFKRFTLAHFTDIHNFYDLFAEGLRVVQSKVIGVVNCGDDSRGISSNDVPIIKEDLQDIMNVVSQNNKLPYIPNVGNHDFTGLTKKEYFDRVCASLTDVVWGDAANYRVYGYRDFTDSTYEGNYRVIMLDPFDYNDGQYSNPYYNMYVVFSQNQINWLIDTLEDAASKGLNVITTMHFSFGDNSLPFGEELAKPDAHYCQDAFMIPDIIKAIQNKTTLNKTYSDSQGVNNISINKDFTNVAQLKYVCHLFGHIHSKNAYRCQKTNGEKYDMLMLGELSLAQNGIALAKTYREQGTVNNMSFSVLAIDSEEQAVYRISYGAYRDYSDPTKNNRVTKHSYRFND
jgi:hypothetical protein